MKIPRCFLSLASLLVLLFQSHTAKATVTINVNPGAYTGQWQIHGVTSALSGANSVTIDPGTYFVRIGAPGSPGNFQISVGADGAAIVLNGVSATGGFETVTFNTSSLLVNPGAYAGVWHLANGVTTAASGPRTLNLVPGVDYAVLVGAPGSIGRFDFSFAANGNVTVHNGVSATGGMGTLNFNTSSLAVNPGAYSGQWHLANGITTSASGFRTLNLVPAVNYAVLVGAPGSIGRFDFSFAADGSVTVHNGVSASGGNRTLTFNTAPLMVDPGAFAGRWHFGNNITTVAEGQRTLELVPAVSYAVFAGIIGRFDIFFAADSAVTVPNGVSAVGGSGSLTFNTVTINTDVGSYTGTWDIERVLSATANKLVKVVPNVNYRFRLISSGPANQDFFVASPCAINPNQFLLLGFSFNITCGPPVANVGPDQTVDEGTLVTLNGTGSTASQGGSLSFSWTQLAGAPVTLSSASSPSPSFTAPFVSPGGETLTFRLIVSESSQTSEPDIVNIHVVNVNKIPVADAGPDQAVQEGSPVTLNGSASYDEDADPLTFAWAQNAGSPVTLNNANTANPSFTAPLVGVAGETLTFKLTVGDGFDTAVDWVSVFVENVNHPPVAHAGPDQTKDEGSLVTLNGSASSDPDADSLSYQWTQIGGSTVTLANSNTASPSFTAPLVGPGGETLVFRLFVHDGLVNSQLGDEVNITVQNVNDPPACNLARANPYLLWPPNHKLETVSILEVSDPNNDTVTIQITSVTQDEPVMGTGDGDTSPDAIIQGDKALVRVERAGGGNGRMYRVHFSASDGQGGSCTGSVTVGVPQSKKPGDTPVNDGQLYDSTQK